MSPRQSDFDDFYLDRLGTQRLASPSQTLGDRLNQPTVIISGLVLVVTVLYHLCGSSAAFPEAVCSLGSHLWDALVHVTPSPLLFALDRWLNPQESQQMIDAQPNLHDSKSAAMRRVLGLDRTGGVMMSVFQARNRALSMTSSALGLKMDTERPAGLGNRDNSCFQNSILQGLASLDALPEYLSICLQNAAADDTDGNKVVTRTLRTLISDLNDSSNNGTTLWTPSKLKFLSTWTQQDAQEYYSKILDDMDKVAAEALKAMKRHAGLESEGGKDDTTTSQHSDDSGYQSLSGSSKASDDISFRNPLEGLLAQRVSCIQCGHSDGLSMIPFNCLTLSLGLRRQHDLYERLDSYSNVEFIEGVECPRCTLLKAQRLLTKLVVQMRSKEPTEKQLEEPLRRLEAVELALEEDQFDEETLADKCKISGQGKVNTTKTKQIVIARPPQSLAVHVNRSVFDPSTFDMVKNSAPVNFPMTLDLGPWCLGSAGGISSPGCFEGSGINEEQWLQEPTASMIAGDLRPSRLSGPIYQLRAVVTHAGRHENGHYICYRKRPRGERPRSGQPSSMPASADAEDQPELEDDKTTDGSDGTSTCQMDWWRLSDQHVSRVDEETISSLSPGVFMLFYDCIDPSMVLQDSAEVSRSVATQAASQVAGTPPGAGTKPAATEQTQITPGKEGQDSGSRDSAVRPESVPLPPEDEGDALLASEGEV